MTTIVTMPDVPSAPLAERAASTAVSAADRETFGALVEGSTAALTKDDAVARHAGDAGSPDRDPNEGAPAAADVASEEATVPDPAAAAAVAAAATVLPAAPVVVPATGPSAGATGIDAQGVSAVTTGAAAEAADITAIAVAPEPARVVAAAQRPAAVVAPEVGEGDAAPATAVDGDAGEDGTAGLTLPSRGDRADPPAGAGADTTDAPPAPGATAGSPVAISGLVPDAAPVAPASDVTSDPGANDASILDPAADAAPWAQVARAVRGVRHHVDGSHTMTVRLDPPELGAVRIELRSHDGRLSIHASAESLATRDTLARALPELRAALEASGLDTGTIDVDTHGTRHQHRDEPPRDGLGGSLHAGRPVGSAASNDEPDRATITTRGEPSRLDLRL
jgi:flagellar hook-length control protein FliK